MHVGYEGSGPDAEYVGHGGEAQLPPPVRNVPQHGWYGEVRHQRDDDGR